MIVLHARAVGVEFESPTELRRLGLTCDLAAARLVKTGLPAFSFMIRKQMPTSKMKIPTTTTAATMMRYLGE
jgi:hypothetical protein